MKKAWMVACVLLCIPVAGFSETPSQAPLSQEALAAILGTPAVTGGCAPQPGAVLAAAKRPRIGLEKTLCTATANCGSGTTVSCHSNVNAANCSATDRNCSVGERGHVTCDGVTTSCPTACCTGGFLEVYCCQCAQTQDCYSCCRCGGGSGPSCGLQCG